MKAKELGVRSVRLPPEVMAAAEVKASELGLTFNDVVEVALRRMLDMKTDAKTELMIEIAQRLRDRFPRRTGFPNHVTRDVFHDIRDDEDLKKLYDEAIRGEDGTVDENKKGTVHKQVGHLVRRVLGAKVVGRSLPLDPEVDLIGSHALLEPSV